MVKLSVYAALIFELLLLTYESKAQTITGPGIEYYHDALGNRYQRKYNSQAVLNKNGDTLNHLSPPDTIQQSNDRNIDQLLIKAYPNPVADELIVENLSWDDKNKAAVKIYDITGRLLQAKHFNSAKQNFSLAYLAQGIYQVSYYLNDRVIYTWKVVKK